MSLSATGLETRRQWPLWVMAAVGLAWLGLAVAPDLGIRGVESLAGRIGSLFPPLVVLLLLAAVLPLRRRGMDIEEIEGRVAAASEASGALEEQLRRLETLLDGCAGKVEQLRAAGSAQGDGLGASAQAMEVAAGTMALSATDMQRAADALAGIIPTMAAQAKEAGAALGIAGGEARRQIEMVEAALAGIAAHGRDAGREAESMVATLQGLIAQIDQGSQETSRAIANRAYTLDAAVTGVLDRSAEAFASIGETLSQQAKSVEQMVATARADLDGFGLEGTRAIGQRLDVLLAAASQLKGQFAEQDAASAQLHEAASARIEALRARLEALRGEQAAAADALLQQADAAIAGVGQRLGALNEGQQQALAALETQLSQAAASVGRELEALKDRQVGIGADMQAEAARVAGEIEVRLDDLRARQQELAARIAADAEASLGQVEGRFVDLGARAAQSHAETSDALARTLAAVTGLQDALSGRTAEVQGLEQRIADLLPAFESFASGSAARLPALEEGLESVQARGRMVADQLDALADRIESQVALLRDSSAAFERDHAAVVDLSQRLAGEFEAARGIVGEIHSTTEQTAIAAAARMVENVMQVRASVNATASEVQSLLSAVVAEAEASLDSFATTKAEAAFGAPIRLQLAALEDASVKAADAAGEASERLTTRLVDLMRVISETEARVDEVDTRMDVRARDTLAARSIRLVESLNEASVDVAKLLAVDVGENAWKRWLDGDRSLFARATVKLADRETARKIARHYAHDEAFEAEATRYLDQFETLIRRVLKDPDGESFALVLLSSDIGKLYVMIAEAVGRPGLRG